MKWVFWSVNFHNWARVPTPYQPCHASYLEVLALNGVRRIHGLDNPPQILPHELSMSTRWHRFSNVVGNGGCNNESFPLAICCLFVLSLPGLPEHLAVATTKRVGSRRDCLAQKHNNHYGRKSDAMPQHLHAQYGSTKTTATASMQPCNGLPANSMIVAHATPPGTIHSNSQGAATLQRTQPSFYNALANSCVA